MSCPCTRRRVAAAEVSMDVCVEVARTTDRIAHPDMKNVCNNFSAAAVCCSQLWTMR